MAKTKNAYTILKKGMCTRDYMGDTYVDWRIILKWIMGSQGLDWIHLARDSVQWRVLVIIEIY
jgi:hypothetical protein